MTAGRTCLHRNPPRFRRLTGEPSPGAPGEPLDAPRPNAGRPCTLLDMMVRPRIHAHHLSRALGVVPIEVVDRMRTPSYRLLVSSHN